MKMLPPMMWSVITPGTVPAGGNGAEIEVVGGEGSPIIRVAQKASLLSCTTHSASVKTRSDGEVPLGRIVFWQSVFVY